jgi:predicted SnoaL-like aldol condensation-catalyzing enzyme
MDRLPQGACFIAKELCMNNVYIACLIAVSWPFFALDSYASVEAQNKRTVEAFYDLAFNKHRPQDAMKLYVGEKYIQHNPNVGDGKQPFINFFSAFFPKNPEASAEIKRSIAEDDLVVLHVHSKLNRQDRGRAVIDIFRLANGKIVEHWDVAQPISEKAANNNTMF